MNKQETVKLENGGSETHPEKYLYVPRWMFLMAYLREHRGASRIQKVTGVTYSQVHIILKMFLGKGWIKVSKKQLTDVRAKEYEFTKKGAALERHVKGVMDAVIINGD